MKRGRVGVLLWAALLFLLLSGCGAQGPAGTVDGPFTVFDCRGVQAAVITTALPELEVRIPQEGDVLLELWERESLKQAEKDGEPPHGLVLRLQRLDEAAAASLLEREPDSQVLARDGDGGFYAVTVDAREQLYRSRGSTREEHDRWDRLVKTAVLLGADLHWRNPELTGMFWSSLSDGHRDLPSVPRLLRQLDDGDLLVDVYPYWHRQKMDELAQVLTMAAGSAVPGRTDVGYAPLLGAKPTWSLEAAWGAKRSLLLSCWETQEPLVSVIYQYQGLTEAVCLSDESLYNLVRHSRDGVRRVDLQAEERHQDILEEAGRSLLAEYADDPAGFTDCRLVQFTTAFTYEESLRSRVEVYDVEFALTPGHPELLVLQDGMYLDGDLNVRGISDLGQLAVRYRDSKPTAEAFLGQENYFPYWEDPAQRWDLASWVLNQAELGTINPVRVLREADVDPVSLASAAVCEDAVGETAERLLFFPRYEVSDFRFFEVNLLRVDGDIRPIEGDILWADTALSPEKPLLVSMELTPGLPRRGFGFHVGDTYYTYGIAVTRDGSIMLMDMD